MTKPRQPMRVTLTTQQQPTSSSFQSELFTHRKTETKPNQPIQQNPNEIPRASLLETTTQKQTMVLKDQMRRQSTSFSRETKLEEIHNVNDKDKENRSIIIAGVSMDELQSIISAISYVGKYTEIVAAKHGIRITFEKNISAERLIHTGTINIGGKLREVIDVKKIKNDEKLSKDMNENKHETEIVNYSVTDFDKTMNWVENVFGSWK